MIAAVIERPELTLPPTEAATLHALFAQSAVILEYGMGGSTVMAAEMPGKRVQSVESDPIWLAGIHQWFAENPPVSVPVLHHANIGPTRKWGHPVDETAIRHWPAYAQGIWDRADFTAPDVVFIDGRFRLACLLTVALRTERPLTVLVDDYIDRPSYHEAEPMLGKPEMIGRMARFDLMPGMIPMNRLRLVIDSHMRPL